MSRIDVFFTSWIVIWVILYYFKLFPYNPKIILACAIIVSLTILVTMIYNNVNIKNIVSFIIIFILTKLFPYYIVENKEISYYDIYFSCIIFFIYLIYLKILFGNTCDVIHKVYIKNICYGEKQPNPLKLFHKLKEYFIN